MLQKWLIGCGIVAGSLIGVPAVVVTLGGYYDPVLRDNIETQRYSLANQANQIDEREEKVIQALAASIDPSSHMEAIKAQAVMVRTYMERRARGIVEEGTLDYMTEEAMAALWPSTYEEIYAIYHEAAYATQGECLYYKDELIEPVYHKESAGMTRDAIACYGEDIPYLKSVPSTADTVNNQKVIFKTELVALLQAAYPEIIVDAHYIEHQIQMIARDTSGYIQLVQVGNMQFEGEVFRQLLGLDSAAFSYTSEGDTLVFETKGIGHGVGLSQHGADKMGAEEARYDDILRYYYTGIEIKK